MSISEQLQVSTPVMGLDSPIAVVTGGRGSIGRAVGDLFLGRGLRVASADRQPATKMARKSCWSHSQRARRFSTLSWLPASIRKVTSPASARMPGRSASTSTSPPFTG